MNSFCALADLAPSGPPTLAALEVVRQMAARSRSPELRVQVPQAHGSPELIAAGAQQTCRNGVRVIASARLDRVADLVREVAPWLEGQPSPSAADLILAAYFRWQNRCPEHLLGDFAFVIWDSRQRSLLAARDPLGIKPLHYARSGTRWCLASEVLCLLAHPDASPELDLESVGDFLTGTDHPQDRTFFRQIRRLPPGHCLHLDLRTTATAEHLWRYWSLDRQIEPCSETEAAERFRSLLRQAVGDRLPASPEVAAIALSGGLDSATVASLACRERARTGAPRTLIAGSLVFDTLGECDERPYLRTILEHLEIPAVTVEAERFWFLGDPEAYQPEIDTPVLSWEGSYRQLLRGLADHGVGVLLTGHGADHLLKGSRRVYSDRLRHGDARALIEVVGYAQRESRDWHFLYKYLAAPLIPVPFENLLRRISGRSLTPPDVPSWIAPELAQATGLQARLHTSWDCRRHMRSAHQEIRELFAQADYLRSVEWYDRNAAPFGIEMRHPFLDRRLVELVLATPPRHLFRLGVYKPLLRQATVGLLPEAVRLRRDKTRLGRFLEYSLREKAPAQVEELLRAPMVESFGLCAGEPLRKAFTDYLQGRPNTSGRMLWNALSLEIWLRRHARSLRSAVGTLNFRRTAA
jgi:asparagine synthase (glutamine-hydrolysing)